MEIKKYFIILLFQFTISNEYMEYQVTLYGVPMSEVVINYENIEFETKNAIKLNFKTHTNKLVSNFFKIDNSYETIIEENTFKILSFKKNTYQPGITNQINTTNQNNKVTYSNANIIIQDDYFNIFSLLYYLTITPFENIKSNVLLEREGLLYNCNIKKNEKNNNYEYQLILNSIDNNKPIIENTDIFTWAVFKKDAYRKVVVGKNNNKIKRCEFKFGMTNLEAKLK